MPVPSAPLNLIATSRNAEATLDWKPPASGNPTGYNVYWSKTSGGPYTLLVTNVQTTYYIDQGLANGATYYYTVTAVNNAGESVKSNEASVLPPLISYFYVIQETTLENLATTINFWNGSAYSLKFIFGLPGSYHTIYDKCYCIWEKAVLPV